MNNEVTKLNNIIKAELKGLLKVISNSITIIMIVLGFFIVPLIFIKHSEHASALFYMMFCIVNISIYIVYCLSLKFKAIKTINGIPVARKRFIQKVDNRMLYNYSEINEMVQYLESIESYLDKYNVYDLKK